MFTERMERILENEHELSAILDGILDECSCAVGTIHRFDQETNALYIVAHHGLPDMLLERVGTIPMGKGMAGIAAERREPVQVCNLQADESGAAKPAAREARMEGSLTVPILDGDTLRGTLGIAKPVAHEFTAEEVAMVMEAGRRIATKL
ncbi:MAG: histidine kinase [Chlorobi bacterium]|nr:histidine kinase [Chlorobiota bacterium]